MKKRRKFVCLDREDGFGVEGNEIGRTWSMRNASVDRASLVARLIGLIGPAREKWELEGAGCGNGQPLCPCHSVLLSRLGRY